MIKKYSLWLMVLLLLVSCSLIIKDPSILEISNCELPCWNSIQVGITDYQEMIEILENIKEVDQGSIFRRNEPTLIFDAIVGFTIIPDVGGTGEAENIPQVEVWADLIDEKIASLRFCGEVGLTIGDVIEATGDPSNVIVTQRYRIPGYNVNLINQDKGVSYWFNTKPSFFRTIREITPETMIRCLKITDTHYFQLLLEAGWFCEVDTSCASSHLIDIMYPWVGYGNIEEKYPYRLP